MSIEERLMRRVEELIVEKTMLERKVSEIQKIVLTDIEANKLLPDGFYHISKLN